VAFVLALAAGIFVFDRWASIRHGFFDLNVYYGAINFWAHGQGELYDYIRPHTEYGFTYPPFAALTMLPMALVPWNVAILISSALTVVSTLVLLYWFVDPIARRQRWTRWFTLAVAACLVAAYEPLRETFLFGQVNMVLLVLVGADVLYLVRRDHRFAGVLIGLATAIKLTPGLFIGYLLLTRRWRAALVASVTAFVATLVAGAVAPDASREFWTDALWNTSRIGVQAFISNQSVNGFVARLDQFDPSRPLWLVLASAVLVVWVWRIRRTATAGDEKAGFALTGVAGCLVSPITWIHHLVWLLPALVLLADRALLMRGRRRLVMLGLAAGLYVLLSSRLVWLFAFHYEDWGLLLANAYLYASLVLLVVLPVPGSARSGRQVQHVPDLVEQDRGPVRPVDRVRGARPVDDEAVPLVEPARPVVGVENP
jgi:alpha-1,2-mannosyltransferase